MNGECWHVSARSGVKCTAPATTMRAFYWMSNGQEAFKEFPVCELHKEGEVFHGSDWEPGEGDGVPEASGGSGIQPSAESAGVRASGEKAGSGAGESAT